MSTNNFRYENVLVVCPDFSFRHDCSYECNPEGGEECGHNDEIDGFDRFAYEEYIQDVFGKLEKIGFEDCDKYESGREGGKIIAKWGLEDNTGMIKWLEVVIRSGYYDGSNIDYIIDGEFSPEDESSKGEIRHINALNKKFDKQVKRVEKILRSCGTEMLKVAQFSNGEAIYQVKK